MSDDSKSPWPEYSPSSWFGQVLMAYRRTVVGRNESDHPAEFLKAVEEHADKEFIFGKEMWRRLQHWREYAERYPDSKPPGTVELFRDRNDREDVELFKDLILSAAFYGDEEFLQILSKTVRLADPPEPDMTPERAVIAAFSHRFGGHHVFRRGEDKLPTAMEVDSAAKGIFKAAIREPISDRQLKRIRKKVGAKTRRSKKKKKLKPGEDSERMILLFGKEAKAAAAAFFSSAASSKVLRSGCHVNRSWLKE